MSLPLVYETLCPRSRSVSTNYKIVCGDKRRGQAGEIVQPNKSRVRLMWISCSIESFGSTSSWIQNIHNAKGYKHSTWTTFVSSSTLYVSLHIQWVCLCTIVYYSSYCTRQSSFTRRAPAVETLVDTLTRWRCMYKWTTMYNKSYAVVSSWRIKVFIHMVMTPPPLVDANSVFSTQHILKHEIHTSCKTGRSTRGSDFSDNNAALAQAPK